MPTLLSAWLALAIICWLVGLLFIRLFKETFDSFESHNSDRKAQHVTSKRLGGAIAVLAGSMGGLGWGIVFDSTAIWIGLGLLAGLLAGLINQI